MKENGAMTWSKILIQTIGTGLTVGGTLWVMMTGYVDSRLKEHINTPGHTWSMHEQQNIRQELKALNKDISAIQTNTAVTKEILNRIEDELILHSQRLEERQ
jgi:hypothetical protein